MSNYERSAQAVASAATDAQDAMSEMKFAVSSFKSSWLSTPRVVVSSGLSCVEVVTQGPC